MSKDPKRDEKRSTPKQPSERPHEVPPLSRPPDYLMKMMVPGDLDTTEQDAVAQNLTRWEYKFQRALTNEEKETLAQLGTEGWEAIGVTMQGSIPLVLLKRPLPPVRNEGGTW